MIGANVFGFEDIHMAAVIGITTIYLRALTLKVMSLSKRRQRIAHATCSVGATDGHHVIGIIDGVPKLQRCCCSFTVKVHRIATWDWPQLFLSDVSNYFLASIYMDPLLPSVPPLARFCLPRLAPLLLCLSLLSSCSIQSPNSPSQAPLKSTSGPALGTGPSPMQRGAALVSVPSPLLKGSASVSRPDPRANGPVPVSVPGPLPVVGVVIALAYCRQFRHAKTKRKGHPSVKEIP